MEYKYVCSSMPHELILSATFPPEGHQFECSSEVSQIAKILNYVHQTNRFKFHNGGGTGKKVVTCTKCSKYFKTGCRLIVTESDPCSCLLTPPPSPQDMKDPGWPGRVPVQQAVISYLVLVCKIPVVNLALEAPLNWGGPTIASPNPNFLLFLKYRWGRWGVIPICKIRGKSLFLPVPDMMPKDIDEAIRFSYGPNLPEDTIEMGTEETVESHEETMAAAPPETMAAAPPETMAETPAVTPQDTALEETQATALEDTAPQESPAMAPQETVAPAAETPAAEPMAAAPEEDPSCSVCGREDRSLKWFPCRQSNCPILICVNCIVVTTRTRKNDPGWDDIVNLKKLWQHEQQTIPSLPCPLCRALHTHYVDGGDLIPFGIPTGFLYKRPMDTQAEMDRHTPVFEAVVQPILSEKISAKTELHSLAAKIHTSSSLLNELESRDAANLNLSERTILAGLVEEDVLWNARCAALRKSLEMLDKCCPDFATCVMGTEPVPTMEQAVTIILPGLKQLLEDLREFSIQVEADEVVRLRALRSVAVSETMFPQAESSDTEDSGNIPHDTDSEDSNIPIDTSSDGSNGNEPAIEIPDNSDQDDSHDRENGDTANEAIEINDSDDDDAPSHSHRTRFRVLGAAEHRVRFQRISLAPPSPEFPSGESDSDSDYSEE